MSEQSLFANSCRLCCLIACFFLITLKELFTIVSGSIAVITLDTSVAHIANRLGCCGVVLFGPENTSIWHNPYGKLRLLEKRDCSYYPCDQWHCRNRENWCMAKITPAMVLEELNKLGKD